MWGSGNLSRVFSGVQGPCLSHHTPGSVPCSYGSEGSRQCRDAGQRGGECRKGGNQEAATLTARPPTPRTCSVPGLHTHHIACEEGLECHHSYCTDEETEAWRGADSWATGTHPGPEPTFSPLQAALSPHLQAACAFQPPSNPPRAWPQTIAATFSLPS